MIDLNACKADLAFSEWSEQVRRLCQAAGVDCPPPDSLQSCYNCGYCTSVVLNRAVLACFEKAR